MPVFKSNQGRNRGSSHLPSIEALQHSSMPSFFPGLLLPSLGREGKEDVLGRGTLFINEGKRDTLARKSCESITRFDYQDLEGTKSTFELAVKGTQFLKAHLVVTSLCLHTFGNFSDRLETRI